MKFITSLIVLSALASNLYAQSGPVAAPQKRMESLDLARKLLTTEPIRVDANALAAKNPFVLRRVAAQEEATPAPTRVLAVNDREVLNYAVGVITPSGTMKVGDVQILLFGQKRLKVGDRLPIIFQGKSYELELTGIDRTSFTLRLNKEEITRPIKPVK